jgi:hypothetical protein
MGKLRLLKELSKRSGYDFRNTFPASQIFRMRWPFAYRCDSEDERKFLIGRIRNYVYNQRRGNFKLPSRYSALVAEVSNSSKREIREKLFHRIGDSVLDCELSNSTIRLANKVLPRCIWRPPRQSLDAMARRVDTHRLALRDWPRNPRSLWPSFPSISEMVEMSRQGKTATGLWRPGFTIPNSATIRDSYESKELATRIVRQNVVAIRSTVKVPREFLPWFRHRWGMLFLTVRYDLPIGLVRLLTSQWIKCPYNLWLQVPCRYKYYLRLHNRADYIRQ